VIVTLIFLTSWLDLKELRPLDISRP
jgi:hypothetical protein